MAGNGRLRLLHWSVRLSAELPSIEAIYLFDYHSLIDLYQFISNRIYSRKALNIINICICSLCTEYAIIYSCFIID